MIRVHLLVAAGSGRLPARSFPRGRPGRRHEAGLRRSSHVVLTRVATALEPTQLAGRIRKALRDPVQTSEGVLTVAPTLGAAVAELDSSASELLRQADRAMYRVELAQR